MVKIDEDHFKRVMSSREHRRQPSFESPAQLKQPSKNRRAAGKLLQSFFSKAGFDVGELDKMLAHDKSESRRTFERQKAEAAKHRAASEAALRQVISSRSAVGQYSQPFTSTFLILDKPFLIWEFPHPELDKFIDSNIASQNSRIKVLVNTNSGSDNTRFSFFFLWVNESDFLAVANVSTSLLVNGSCEVDAAARFWSGDTADLKLDASLSLIRWSGWGNDPVTGASLDGTEDPDIQSTQSQEVAHLHAEGDPLYWDVGHDPKVLHFSLFDLSHRMFAIPGRAVAVFEVSLSLQYSFADGENISDLISVDFANNDAGNFVQCPLVILEILTAPSSVAAGLTAGQKFDASPFTSQSP